MHSGAMSMSLLLDAFRVETCRMTGRCTGRAYFENGSMLWVAAATSDVNSTSCGRGGSR